MWVFWFFDEHCLWLQSWTAGGADQAPGVDGKEKAIQPSSFSPPPPPPSHTQPQKSLTPPPPAPTQKPVSLLPPPPPPPLPPTQKSLSPRPPPPPPPPPPRLQLSPMRPTLGNETGRSSNPGAASPGNRQAEGGSPNLPPKGESVSVSLYLPIHCCSSSWHSTCEKCNVSVVCNCNVHYVWSVHCGVSLQFHLPLCSLIESVSKWSLFCWRDQINSVQHCWHQFVVQASNFARYLTPVVQEHPLLLKCFHRNQAELQREHIPIIYLFSWSFFISLWDAGQLTSSLIEAFVVRCGWICRQTLHLQVLVHLLSKLWGQEKNEAMAIALRWGHYRLCACMVCTKVTHLVSSDHMLIIQGWFCMFANQSNC